MKLAKCRVIVRGSVIGYQFNKKSLGSRTVTATVTKTDGNMGIIHMLGRTVNVRQRYDDIDTLWEAI